jgi:monoamine oxidase
MQDDAHHEPRITRRRLAGVAAGGAAGAALSATGAGAAATKRPRARRQAKAHVVVVGAGLAGLVAADRIGRAGRSVVVLEARERPGGRIKNWRCGSGKPCDCGQLVDARFTRVRELAKELGVDFYPQYVGGSDLQFRGGQRTTTPASGPGRTRDLLDVVAPDATAAFARLNEMAKSVPIEAPWETPNAAELDAETLKSWQDENIQSARGRSIFELIVWGATSAEIGDVSLLHLLTYLARLGEPGDPGETGRVLDFLLEADYVDGGMQRIPDELAKRLGERVVYRSPVRRIDQAGRRVTVESDRLRVTAKQVIVAVSPSVSAAIDYSPALPPLRMELTERYPQGTMVTFSATYERPFWRDAGLSGRVGADTALNLCVDITPPDVEMGILTGLALGVRGRRISRRSPDERRQIALDNLAVFFGDQAREPMMFLERHWSSPPWTRGCPGFLPPGVITEHGPAVNAPVGRVRWANTEHATSFNTFTEGAVRSGERVAGEVLAAL